MILTTLIPQQNVISITIPTDLIGKKIEIHYQNVDEILEAKPKKKSIMAKYRGILSAETADALLKEVEKSRNEWDRNI